MNGFIQLNAILVALAMMALVDPPHLENPESSQFLRDTHVFRRILFEHQLQPLKSFDAIWKDPRHTLLVVLGPVGRQFFTTGLLAGDEAKAAGIQNSPIEEPLKLFLQKGGAILYATDHDSPAEQSPFVRDIEDLTGFGIDGSILQVLETGNGFYYRNLGCPVLETVPGARPDLLALPQMDPEKKLPVATNRPTRLVSLKAFHPIQVRPVLLLPEQIGFAPTLRKPRDFPGRLIQTSLPVGDKPRQSFARPEERVFGLVYEGNKNRNKLLLLADHSLFINSMMLPTDNANVEFASKSIQYLCENGTERRDKVLLLEEGQINARLEVPLKKMDSLSGPQLNQAAVETILKALDDRLASLEDKNAFDSGLERWMESRNITPRSLTFTALAYLSILLGAWIFYQFLQSRKDQLEKQIQPADLSKTDLQESDNLVVGRYRDMLRTGNAWETARSISRTIWDDYSASIPISQETMPRFQVKGSFLESWTRKRRARRYWNLAYGKKKYRIRPRGWTRFLADIERLRSDLRDGTVQVRPPA